MPLTTCSVSATVTTMGGVPVLGALLEARISASDRDSGLVVPAVVRAKTSVTGEAVLELWPNSRGSAGTTYTVKVSGPGIKTQRYEGVSVPDQASAVLSDLVDLGPPPTKTDAEAAELAAQGYASAAQGYASDAEQALADMGGAATLITKAEAEDPSGTDSRFVSGQRLAQAIDARVRVVANGAVPTGASSAANPEGTIYLELE